MPFPDAEFREAAAPVLLEFGTTVWHCQMFESNVCFLLALISEEKAAPDGKVFHASLDFYSRKTLGGLIRALQDLLDVPKDIEEFLWIGVETRNRIVHGYMTNNTAPLFDPKGRLGMIEELQYLRGDIDVRDMAIEKIILAFLRKYGIKSPALRTAAERLWRSANAKGTHDADSGVH